LKEIGGANNKERTAVFYLDGYGTRSMSGRRVLNRSTHRSSRIRLRHRLALLLRIALVTLGWLLGIALGCLLRGVASVGGRSRGSSHVGLADSGVLLGQIGVGNGVVPVVSHNAKDDEGDEPTQEDKPVEERESSDSNDRAAKSLLGRAE